MATTSKPNVGVAVELVSLVTADLSRLRQATQHSSSSQHLRVEAWTEAEGSRPADAEAIVGALQALLHTAGLTTPAADTSDSDHAWSRADLELALFFLQLPPDACTREPECHTSPQQSQPEPAPAIWSQLQAATLALLASPPANVTAILAATTVPTQAHSACDATQIPHIFQQLTNALSAHDNLPAPLEVACRRQRWHVAHYLLAWHALLDDLLADRFVAHQWPDDGPPLDPAFDTPWPCLRLPWTPDADEASDQMSERTSLPKRHVLALTSAEYPLPDPPYLSPGQDRELREALYDDLHEWCEPFSDDLRSLLRGPIPDLATRVALLEAFYADVESPPATKPANAMSRAQVQGTWQLLRMPHELFDGSKWMRLVLEILPDGRLTGFDDGGARAGAAVVGHLAADGLLHLHVPSRRIWLSARLHGNRLDEGLWINAYREHGRFGGQRRPEPQALGLPGCGPDFMLHLAHLKVKATSADQQSACVRTLNAILTRHFTLHKRLHCAQLMQPDGKHRSTAHALLDCLHAPAPRMLLLRLEDRACATHSTKPRPWTRLELLLTIASLEDEPRALHSLLDHVRPLDGAHPGLGEAVQHTETVAWREKHPHYVRRIEQLVFLLVAWQLPSAWDPGLDNRRAGLLPPARALLRAHLRAFEQTAVAFSARLLPDVFLGLRGPAASSSPGDFGDTQPWTSWAAWVSAHQPGGDTTWYLDALDHLGGHASIFVVRLWRELALAWLEDSHLSWRQGAKHGPETTARLLAALGRAGADVEAHFERYVRLRCQQHDTLPAEALLHLAHGDGWFLQLLDAYLFLAFALASVGRPPLFCDLEAWVRAGFRLEDVPDTQGRLPGHPSPLLVSQAWLDWLRTTASRLGPVIGACASQLGPAHASPLLLLLDTSARLAPFQRLPLLRTRETATVSRSRMWHAMAQLPAGARWDIRFAGEAASGEGVEREFFDLFGRVVLQPGRALVQHRRAALRDFGHGSNDPGAAERLLTCLGEWALGSEGLSLVESSAESGLLTPAIYHLDQEKPQPWVVQAGRAYRLVGKYLAQALLQKQATPLCWAPHVLRLVFDLPLRVADYAAWQPEHHRQLVQLLAAAARGEPVEEWDLTFDVDVRAGGMHAWGTAVTLSLDHSGVVERAVTAHSAVEFVHELMLARMNLARPAALAMQAGVLEVLPRAKWTLLTDDVVASVTCPSTDITAAMLWPALEVRDGRDLVRFPDERPFAVFVEWLQSVVSTWSRTSCEQFVRFATGRSILAPDVLPIKVEVKPARAALPEAQTCFSIVRIPFYADAASLSEALTLVLAHSQGFGLE